MPAASPRQGGFTHSEEDFPPLTTSIITSAVVEPSPIKPTYVESTRTKPFIPISNLPPLSDVAIKSPIVTEKDGVKAVIFQQEEVEASMQAFKYALVARFHGERPSVDTFERFVNSEWGLKKPAVVGLLNPRHIMIRLESEDDFTHAWVREDNFFNNHRFTLFKWSEGILESKVMKRAVWIELLKLPVMYQVPSMLEQIANNIGRFLRLDERTRAGKHPIAPRLCIELDLAAPLPTEVWVGYVTSTGKHIGFTQNITYDFTRSKCSSCKSLGHELPQCQQHQAKVLNFKRRATNNSDNPKISNGFRRQTWVVKPQQLKTTIETKGKDSTPNHSPQIVHSMSPSRQGKVDTLDKVFPTFPCHIPLVPQEKNKEMELPISAIQPNGHKELAPFLKAAPSKNPIKPIQISTSNSFEALFDPLEENKQMELAIHLDEQKDLAPSSFSEFSIEPIIPLPTSNANSFVVLANRNENVANGNFQKENQGQYLHEPELVLSRNELPSNPDFTRAIVPYAKPLQTILDSVYYEVSKEEQARQQEITPLKILQDSSKEQAEFIEALTREHTTPTDQEVFSREKTKHSVQPSFPDSVRKASQSRIKVYSRARRAEGNSFGRIKPGMKWADVIDSEEEK